MVHFFVFAVAISILWAGGNGCGVPSLLPDVQPADLPNLIVKGKEAVPHSWPWQVRLQHRDPSVDRWGGMCGGSLITPKHVLTAAHCFDKDKDPNNWRVFIGAHNISKSSNDYTVGYVDEVDIHVGYDKVAVYPHHDIAVMTLKEPIQFGSYAIDICLTNTDFDAGKRCFTTGWGQTTEYDPGSTVLLQADDFILPPTLCQPYYKNRVKLDTTMICAFNTENSSGFCNGDSGGPLVCQTDDGVWQLQGITSFTVGCGRIPDVYTRVPHFYKWIQERITIWK